MSKGLILASCVVVALAGAVWWLNRGEEPLLVLTTVEEYADVVLCPEPGTRESVTDEPMTWDEDSETFLELLEQSIQTLERIEPPPELRDYHKSYIDTLRPGVEDYRAIGEAAADALDPEVRAELEAICFPRRERQAAERESQFGG